MMEMNDDILDRLKAGRFFLPAFLLVSGSIAHNGFGLGEVAEQKS